MPRQGTGMIAIGTNAACFWDDSDTGVPVSRCRSNEELLLNTRYYTLLLRHQAFAVLTFAWQHLQHHGRWVNASALQATAVHPHCCCAVTTPPECLPGICPLLTSQGWSRTPSPGSVNWMDTSRPAAARLSELPPRVYRSPYASGHGAVFVPENAVAFSGTHRPGLGSHQEYGEQGGKHAACHRRCCLLPPVGWPLVPKQAVLMI
jgi:hypothetical protein